MANLSKIKREKMIAYLNELKELHSDDNSITALNEIENFINEKKYGLVFEQHEEEVDELLKTNIPVLIEDNDRVVRTSDKKPMNFIIEGENLQALYLLAKTHKGKIDCIYIDPPYNTGAKDWKYNNKYVDETDKYRHSLWLSMMEERLKIAKTLLKKDGALITTIDDNEFANVFLLIQDIFPSAKHNVITIQMNPGGTQGKAFSVTNEYAIITYFKETTIYRQKHEGGDTYNLRRWGSTSNRFEGATCFYPIILNSKKEIIGFGDVLCDDKHPTSQIEYQKNGEIYVWPLDINNNEKKWRYARDTVESVKERMFIEEHGNRIEILLRRDTEPPKTVWIDPSYNSESHGTKLLKKFLCDRKFPYPKSLYAVKDCLYLITQGKKNAVILDFFAGSGTTFHAVNLLNKEDNGNRKCIMVTNNAISYDEEKRLKRLGYKQGDEEWEKIGIARYINWPRAVCTIKGVDINGNPVNDQYLNTDFKFSDGFEANVKYLKCDWTPRKPEDYLLSNILCLHIKEMLELQNFIEIDNKKYVLVLNKNDYKEYVEKSKNVQIKHLWYNQNIIFTSKELSLIKKCNGKPIPNEFFGEELKEAGE